MTATTPCRACYEQTVALHRGEQELLEFVRAWHDFGRAIAHELEPLVRQIERLTLWLDRLRDSLR